MLKCSVRVFKFSKRNKTLDSSTVHHYKGSRFSEIVLYYESDAQHYWFEVDRNYTNVAHTLTVSKDGNQICDLLCYITNPEKEDQNHDGKLFLKQFLIINEKYNIFIIIYLKVN
jgi:hypothetical protein